MLPTKSFARFLLLFISTTLIVNANGQLDEDKLKLQLKVEFYVDMTSEFTVLGSVIESLSKIGNLATEVADDTEDSDTKTALQRAGKEIAYLIDVMNAVKPVWKNTKINDVSFGEFGNILQCKAVLDLIEYIFAVGKRLSELSGKVDGNLISQKGKNDLRVALNNGLEAITIMQTALQYFFDTVESKKTNITRSTDLSPEGLSCQITTGGGTSLIPRDTEVVVNVMKDASDAYKSIASGLQSLQTRIN